MLSAIQNLKPEKVFTLTCIHVYTHVSKLVCFCHFCLNINTYQITVHKIVYRTEEIFQLHN